MSTEFRIIPRRGRFEKSGPCWSLRVLDHPRGIIEAAGEYYPAGSYIVSWPTREEAEVAALNLGMDPLYDVYSSFVYVSEKQ